MSAELKRLPDSELEVMLALWDCGGEASRSQIEEKLSDFHWAVNTINTFLTRLCARKFISVRKAGKTNYYLPLVSKEEYLAFESRGILKKLYGGSVSSFVAAFSDSNKIDENEIKELQSLIDELKG